MAQFLLTVNRNYMEKFFLVGVYMRRYYLHVTAIQGVGGDMVEKSLEIIKIYIGISEETYTTEGDHSYDRRTSGSRYKGPSVKSNNKIQFSSKYKSN